MMRLLGFLLFVFHLCCTTSQVLTLEPTPTLAPTFQDVFFADPTLEPSFVNTDPSLHDSSFVDPTGGANSPNSPALTKVVVEAYVGVLLDEIPVSQRAALVAVLSQKNNAWWQARAELQIDLTGYRLTYRTFYYTDLKYQLVLPPHDQWSFVWSATPPSIITYQSHKVFARGYNMTTYILSTKASITLSEPALGRIGGQWLENFSLPVDPTLLFQRTGFACVDEGQYPPGVADPERMDFVFDDTCDVEHEIDIGPLGCSQCHCTLPLPTQSCKASLHHNVGSIQVSLAYTRVSYDAHIASQIRTPTPTANGSDLSPSSTDLEGTRVLYRYFPNGSCERAVDELCIGGYGWRRLLYFDATDQNVGLVDMDMETTAFVDVGIEQTPPAQEIAFGLYEYSSCHHHYHFRHFGTFVYNTSLQVPINSKRGFCIAAVDRWANAEWSPTWSNFSTCETQGITAGWEDVYQQGISCQWIDITNVPAGTTVGTLSSGTNPDGLLCEGTLEKYPNGSQKYELTNFTTLTGNPVSKQSCNLLSNYSANNQISGSVPIPDVGRSYVTQPCIETDQHFGPLRNCEFTPITPSLRTCTPGQTKNLTCTFISATSINYQVLRVCEASRALNVGTACRDQDALQNLLIQSGTTFTFQCPSARDSVETGGLYSLYTAALWGSNSASVSCS